MNWENIWFLSDVFFFCCSAGILFLLGLPLSPTAISFCSVLFSSGGTLFLLAQKKGGKRCAKGGMSFVSKDIPSEFAKQTRIRFNENLVTSLRLRKLAR